MSLTRQEQRFSEDAYQVGNFQNNSHDNHKWPIYQRAIHIHETDKDGVLHFSNYFKIAEEAMFTGFREIGFSFENSPYSVAMLNAATTYIKPVKFGDRIDVVLIKFTKKRVRFILAFEFRNHKSVPVARIELTLVLIMTEGRKAIPVPTLLKAAFEKVPIDLYRTSPPESVKSCICQRTLES